MFTSELPKSTANSFYNHFKCDKERINHKISTNEIIPFSSFYCKHFELKIHNFINTDDGI